MCGRGRVLAEPRLSPDGELVAFVATQSGRAALVVVPATGGPELVVTTDPPPPPTSSHGGGIFDWTPDSQALLYVAVDRCLYLQPITGGPPRGIVRDGPVAGPAACPDGERVAYVSDGRHVAVASLRPHGPWPTRLSGAPDFAIDPAWSPDGRLVAWHEWLDPSMPWDDSRIAVARADASAPPTVLAVARPDARHQRATGARPDATGQLTGGHGTGGQFAFGQPRFSPDGLGLAFLCDASGWLNLWFAGVPVPGGAAGGGEPWPEVADSGLHFLRSTVGAAVPEATAGLGMTTPDPVPMAAEAAEHGDPSWGPGQRSYAWAPDARHLAFCRNEAGFGQLCVLSLETAEVHEVDRGVYQSLSWAGGRICGLRSGARTPHQVVVIDASLRLGESTHDGAARHGGWRRTVARGPVAGFEAAGLAEPEVVEWDGEDVAGLGTTVHGRLYRADRHSDGPGPPYRADRHSDGPGPPYRAERHSDGRGPPYRADRQGDGPGPLLVWIHGGPTGQHRVTFDARVAYFSTRGWNILHVDHRGSTGWGRDYAQALAGEWGRLDVADTAAGMGAAAERGWGDPRRMVPIGASSGGMTVLLLLALYPELCAAGIDLYGVTDLFDQDDTTNRLEAHYLSSLVGQLPADAPRYEARSPIRLATRIGAPLLVLQGSADKVVARSQSDNLVAAVRAAGGTVEYHVYEGEGHGWGRAEVVEDELERIWAFLRRHVLRRR